MHRPRLQRQGRHARRRFSLRCFAGALFVASLEAISGINSTLAQEPTPNTRPTIPPTVVEAESGPATMPETVVEESLPADAFEPSSVLEGTLFDSPFFAPPVAGYGATTATGGVLANTPLLNIPQHVNVVTADAMRDQQIFSVTDAFRNISGLGADHTTGTLAASSAEFNYLARGLPSTYRRWNGYRSDLVQPNIDAANIERIEFLKGPSSTLYGASEAGGFLNVVTKKPLNTDFTNVSLSAGSWGLARTTLDANRVLNDFTQFRLNVGLQSADSFRDFVNDDRIQITPVMTILLTESTYLTLEGEYYLANTKYDLGYPAINGDPYLLPRSRFTMDPSDRADGDYYKSLIQLNHTLSESWSAQLGYHYANANQRVQTWSPFGEFFGFIPQYPGMQDQQGSLSSLNGQVVGEVETGEMTHHLAGGFEFQWIDTAAQTGFDFFGDYGAGAGLGYPLFAFSPLYASQAGIPFPTLTATPFRLSIDADVASVQDRLTINDYWELVGGVSYQNFDRSQRQPGANFDDNVNGWTPKGAVLFHPVPEFVSTWYSYTESLNSQLLPLVNTNLQGQTTPLDPSQGQQHEIGLRIVPSDDLVLSASLFSLDKSGVPIFGLAPPFGPGSVAVDAHSQGVELDLYGRVTERLHLIANYAYTDAKVTDEKGAGLGIVGQQFPLVPHNRAYAWGRYNVIDDRWDEGREKQVLGVGLGTRWIGSSTTPAIAGFLGPALDLPSMVTFDAGMFYERNRLSANLYFENLGDRTYFASGMGSFVNPGNPFNVRATVGWSF